MFVSFSSLSLMATTSKSWNWGLPGIQIAEPPIARSADLTTVPPAYEDLKFNPLGLYNLRRRLGVLVSEPGIFNHFQHKFEAADLAWLAAGASQDGRHSIEPSHFFPAFTTLRDSLPTDKIGREHRKWFSKRIMSLLCDLATMWDRAFGGSTIILHVDGTTPPNTVLTPDCLKANIHLPPHFVDEHPQSHLAIAHIVQIFIEHVGLPTVERWKRSAHLKGWDLSQPGHSPAVHPPAARLIPTPSSSTSHYIFWGRPRLNLPALTSQPLPTPPAVSLPQLAHLSKQVNHLTMELAAAQELANERLGVIVEYEERQDHLVEREQDLVSQEGKLQEQIRCLKEKLKGCTRLFYSFWPTVTSFTTIYPESKIRCHVHSSHITHPYTWFILHHGTHFCTQSRNADGSHI
ncbi:hypothetical protein DFH09DRAFT_1342444 [Mycena vulgaris]|nr:hypothetical protein DFH09DRAFT_1342444 [Mycena vulgaris]